MGVFVHFRATSQKKSETFGLMEGGVPISGLKQLIAMKTADRSKPGVQSGVPKDSLDNNCEWIYNSHMQILKLTKGTNSHQG
jgi:hypothetical protein